MSKCAGPESVLSCTRVSQDEAPVPPAPSAPVISLYRTVLRTRLGSNSELPWRDPLSKWLWIFHGTWMLRTLWERATPFLLQVGSSRINYRITRLFLVHPISIHSDARSVVTIWPYSSLCFSISSFYSKGFSSDLTRVFTSVTTLRHSTQSPYIAGYALWLHRDTHYQGLARRYAATVGMLLILRL